MKKIISVSIFLLVCTMDLESRDSNASAQETSRLFAFNCANTVCCKRGPRGRRGKTGRRGPSGADVTDPGMNEFFMDAFMMTGGIVEGFPVFPTILAPYGFPFTSFRVWAMPVPGGDLILPPITTTFDLPIDMDVTQPVTIVAHVFVGSDPATTGSLGQFNITLDVEPNQGLTGVVPPAPTGPQFSVDSPVFTVTPAVPALSSNVRYIRVATPLTLTGAAIGEWVNLMIERISTNDDFSGTLYLDTISVQYQRVAS